MIVQEMACMEARRQRSKTVVRFGENTAVTPHLRWLRQRCPPHKGGGANGLRPLWAETDRSEAKVRGGVLAQLFKAGAKAFRPRMRDIAGHQQVGARASARTSAETALHVEIRAYGP